MLNKIENKFNKIITIPTSKSLTIRALILAAISSGKTIIYNVLESGDTKDCINALKSLGIEIKVNGGEITIDGCNGNFNISKNLIYVGSSGLTARFLLAILVAVLGQTNNLNKKIIFDGSGQLRGRTIQPLVDTLIALGANIKYVDKKGFLPLEITPTKLNPVNAIEISGKLSSQYVSAMLTIAPLLDFETTVNIIDINSENNSYIQMTTESMEHFGVFLHKIEQNKYISKPQKYIANNLSIEPDFNTANYFFSLAAVLHSKIEIMNLNENTLQPGIKFLQLLEKMNCKVEYKKDSIVLENNGQLKGGFEIDMFDMGEMATTLACVAVFADGPITIKNVEHIRNHECDRIKSIATELTKCGVKVEEFPDGLKVYPEKNIKNTTLNVYNDHRMAMSLSILLAKSNLIMDNQECVEKTCPGFFNILKLLYK